MPNKNEPTLAEIIAEYRALLAKHPENEWPLCVVTVAAHKLVRVVSAAERSIKLEHRIADYEEAYGGVAVTRSSQSKSKQKK